MALDTYQTIVKAMLWKKEVWQMLTWEYFIYTAREAWHVIGEFIVVSDVLLYIWRAGYV